MVMNDRQQQQQQEGSLFSLSLWVTDPGLWRNANLLFEIVFFALQQVIPLWPAAAAAAAVVVVVAAGGGTRKPRIHLLNSR